MCLASLPGMGRTTGSGRISALSNSAPLSGSWLCEKETAHDNDCHDDMFAEAFNLVDEHSIASRVKFERCL